MTFVFFPPFRWCRIWVFLITDIARYCFFVLSRSSKINSISLRYQASFPCPPRILQLHMCPRDDKQTFQADWRTDEWLFFFSSSTDLPGFSNQILPPGFLVNIWIPLFPALFFFPSSSFFVLARLFVGEMDSSYFSGAPYLFDRTPDYYFLPFKHIHPIGDEARIDLFFDSVLKNLYFPERSDLSPIKLALGVFHGQAIILVRAAAIKHSYQAFAKHESVPCVSRVS